MVAKRKIRGFSLIETMVVVAILLIATAVSVLSIGPAVKAARVTGAYNTVLGVMRQARDNSIGQRQVFIVTFNPGANPDNVTITQALTGTVLYTEALPSDVFFTVVPGFPTSQVTFPITPDGFGVGATAVDFDQNIVGGIRNAIYFQPDGSAQDVNGNINNGVVYITRTGDLYDARAITLWGATGRMRGWHMYTQGANYYWREQ